MSQHHIQTFNIEDFYSKVPSCVTIGNFDGGHRGHINLLKAMQLNKQKHNCQNIAITFNPRPEVFFTGHKQKDLFTIEQKTRFLAAHGIDIHLIQTFDQNCAQTPCETFFQETIIKRCHAKYLFIGHDAAIGKDRQGSAHWMLTTGISYGLTVTLENTTTVDNKKIASSSIRDKITQGDIIGANRDLNRPYLLEGTIVKGQQRGRTLGFPTLNLNCRSQLLPAPGVYASWVWLQDSPAPLTPSYQHLLGAATNVGYSPTVATKKTLRIEAHLIEYSLAYDQNYGKKAAVYLVSKIRDEKKFSSIMALKAQISADIILIKSRLKHQRGY